MTEQQMKGLRQSMKKFGYLTPIIVDKNSNKIVDGAHRATVYKELGLTEIPAIVMDLESDTDRRQLRQVMNKLHGFHDKEMDANELVQIFQSQKLDELSELIAQPREDLQRMMLRYHPGLEFVTPENEEEIDKLIDEEMKRIAPDTALGDIWQLGDHRIMCADCSDTESINKLFEDRKADLTVTSPPYDNLRDYEGYDFDFEIVAKSLFEITQDGGVVIWIAGDATIDGSETLSSFKQAIRFKEIGFRVHDTMIFAKSAFSNPATTQDRYHQTFEYMFILSKGKVNTFNALTDRQNKQASRTIIGATTRQRDGTLTPQRPHFINDFGMRFNIWYYDIGYMQNTPDREAYEHPAIFPINLVKDHIHSWSNEGDLVYDPMLGSGTVLVAAEQTGRTCYGIDISPRYIDIAIKRWEKYTGKEAVKL